LLDIGATVLRENKLSTSRRRRIERLVEDETFPQLARELDVRVIHCSERDTQRANLAKDTDEFVSTWSPEGLWEGIDFSRRAGLGTHDEMVFRLARAHPARVPAHQTSAAANGAQHLGALSGGRIRRIVAMVVTHGESFGLYECTDGTLERRSADVSADRALCLQRLQRLDDFVARTPRPTNYELHPMSPHH